MSIRMDMTGATGRPNRVSNPKPCKVCKGTGKRLGDRWSSGSKGSRFGCKTCRGRGFSLR